MMQHITILLVTGVAVLLFFLVLFWHPADIIHKFISDKNKDYNSIHNNKTEGLPNNRTNDNSSKTIFDLDTLLQSWTNQAISPTLATTEAVPSPSPPRPDRESFRKNWKGHCSYPSYLSEKVQSQPWFPRYLHHLQQVNLSTSAKGRRPFNCARWWYPTPQYVYKELPPRAIGWTPNIPVNNFTRPKCADFGQELIKPTRCARAHEVLWRHLEKIGVIYFPRSGTELGVVRGSKVLSSDGDLDVFVDMPQAKLIQEVSKVLQPSPYTSGNLKDITAETHWRVRGCPAVHMVFNDWMADETVARFGRPNHDSTCVCMMNSIRMTCHKEARYRIYVQYGPSWKVPLHAKYLDFPSRARGSNVEKKLKKLSSNDGIIYEAAVRALDKTVVYDPEEMEMILAQLNVLKELIAYQRRTRDYSFV